MCDSHLTQFFTIFFFPHSMKLKHCTILMERATEPGSFRLVLQVVRNGVMSWLDGDVPPWTSWPIDRTWLRIALLLSAREFLYSRSLQVLFGAGGDGGSHGIRSLQRSCRAAALDSIECDVRLPFMPRSITTRVKFLFLATFSLATT